MIEMFTRYGKAVQVPEGAKGFTQVKKCGRCGGQGGAEQWRYTGYTCYDCGGRGTMGTETIKVYTAEKLAKLNATKAKADAKRAAAAAAKQAAWAAEALANREAFLAANAALIERAKPYMTTNAEGEPSFIARVITKAIEKSHITEGQATAILNVIEKIETAAKVAAASEHVGQVGKRIEVAVTVERVTEFIRPKFGAHWIEECFAIVTMRTAEGAAIVSKSTSFWSEKGRQLKIRATVKEHTEYKGEKQTIIQRVAVLEPKEAA